MVGEEFFEDGIILFDKEIIVSVAALDDASIGMLTVDCSEKRISVPFFNDLFNRGKIYHAIPLSETLQGYLIRFGVVGEIIGKITNYRVKAY